MNSIDANTEFRPLDILSVPLYGRSLIEASAGTGKTFTIAHLYIRLLIESGCEVGSLLVVTFTEAATKELRERIRGLLIQALEANEDPERIDSAILKAIIKKNQSTGSRSRLRTVLKKAIVSFDEAAIYTIHGFCNRVLQDNAFESGMLFDTELVADQSTFVREAVADFWRTRFGSAHPVFSAAARCYGVDFSGLLSFAEIIIRHPTGIPEPPAGAGDREGFLSCFMQLKQQWQRDREDIVHLLYNDPRLCRVKSRKESFSFDKLESDVFHLDQGFSQGPFHEQIKTIERLSRTQVQAASGPEHPFFDLCEGFVHRARGFVTDVRHDFFQSITTALYQKKRAAHKQSFDDLLLSLRQALGSSRGEALASAVRRRFSCALIDEFQDTDPVQYSIFDRLFSEGSLIIVGDPKQSIYRFRGADIFSYLEAAGSMSPENRFTLDTNRRSESGFVAAANHLFDPGRCTNVFILGQAIASRPVTAAPDSMGNRMPLTDGRCEKGRLVLWNLSRTASGKALRHVGSKPEGKDIALQAVVSEISRLLSRAPEAGGASLGGYPLRPSDIAILVTTNQEARMFRDVLSDLDIPAALTHTGNIFETEEAADVERFLSAAAAPGRLSRVNGVLITPLVGMTAPDLIGCLEDDTRFAEYETHLEHFRAYNDLWHRSGFMTMFRRFLSDYHVREKLLCLPGGERRLTNVLHVAECIHRAVLEGRLGAAGTIAWLRRARTGSAVQDEHELRLERDDEAVTILTVHKSKGLEFPIVFCPCLWAKDVESPSPPFPYHEKNALRLYIGVEENPRRQKAAAEKESLAELMRLAYVAITRARNRCYLAYGKIGKKGGRLSAPAYLFAGGANPDPESLEKRKGNLSESSPEDIDAVMRRCAQGAADTMVLTYPETDTFYPLPVRETDDSPISCRSVPDRPIAERSLTLASYSMLVAGRSPEQETAADYEPGDIYTADLDEIPPESFFAFPRGAQAGSCIHRVFETIDFQHTDGPEAAGCIEAALEEFGLKTDDPVVRSEQVSRMVRSVMHSPLPGAPAGFVLADLNREDRLMEPGFYYPLPAIGPEALAARFARSSKKQGDVCSRLAGATARLDFGSLQGFMRGFIDMVFYHEGSYYIADWKTNHLGNRYEDYTPDRLAACMDEALYTLQYHLYIVAADRYLRTRIPGYRYEDHFGGAYYLFVRGMSPDHPGCGIFHDRPDASLIRELGGSGTAR